MKYYILSALLLTGLAGCGGDKHNEPTPTAQLSGQVQPAAAVTAVTATDSGKHTYSATLTGMGGYSFAALPIGTYSLGFTTTARYAAPLPAPSVTLTTAGATVPLLTLIRSAASASYKVDGVPVTCTYFYNNNVGNYNSMQLRLRTDASVTTTTIEEVILGFNSIPTVGAYPMPTRKSSGVYITKTGGFYVAETRIPISGIAEITDIDTQARLVSGTFSFIGSLSGAASPKDAVISEGIFTNVKY